MHQCLKLIWFWNNSTFFGRSLRPPSAVHDCTYSCQTDTAVCLLTSRQQYLFDICLLLYVQSWTPDDGRKHRPKHVELFQSQINLRHWCIWLVLLQKPNRYFCTKIKCLFLYVQSWTPDDGRKDRPKHVELFQNQINLRHWCIWLVLL